MIGVHNGVPLSIMASVKVTLSDSDGVVLDAFNIHWWDDHIEDEDSEGVGSPASESALVERIRLEVVRTR